MSHITEDTVTRLREQIVKGARLVRRYWDDHGTPFTATDWQTAEGVTFDGDGWLTVTYLRYATESSRTREKRTALYSPDTVIALADRSSAPNGRKRLILPGGYMDAVDGGNLRTWDVFATDGTRLAQEIGTADARYLLEERAPEMIWRDHGDGKFTARGHGREWLVTRDGRNPEYTAHMPMSRAWLYALLSRPLGAHEYVAVIRECETPDAARACAPVAEDAAPLRWMLMGREHIAQGRGMQWTIVEQTGEHEGRYVLSARPLEGGESVTVAEDCASLDAAKQAAQEAPAHH